MIIDFRMRPPARGFLNIGVYDNVERTAKLTGMLLHEAGPFRGSEVPRTHVAGNGHRGRDHGSHPGRNGHFKGTSSTTTSSSCR